MPSTSRSSQTSTASSPTPSIPPDLPRPRVLDDTLSVKEAAELSGKHEQTIRNWMKRELFTFSRLGGRDIRIHRTEFLRFLEGQGTPEQEIASPAPTRAPADETGRLGGGLYDPDWGLFDRSPFHGT